MLVSAIESASSEQLDTLWSILKYKEIGIFRKVKCMSQVLGLDFIQIVEKGFFNLLLPHSTNGIFRIIQI